MFVLSVEGWMFEEEERECFGDENHHGADRLPRELLLSCVRKNSKRQDGDSDEHYLGKITHVNLSGKNLTHMKGLELCKKMQTLYLYENKLERLSSLSFARGLTHLYLQHNRLRSFRGLGALPALTKLYADYNNIDIVSDLEGCTSLAELHLSHQQRAPVVASTSETEEKGLTFAPDTLRVLAESLQTLSIRGCTLERIDVLGDLRALESIDASDSDIDDITEVRHAHIIPILYG